MGKKNINSNNTLIPKIIYKQVLKIVEHYREQDRQDKKEHPNRLPTSWGGCLKDSITKLLIRNRIRNAKSLTDQVLHMLYEQGKITIILGEYGFDN